jgi:hypothetical protein
LIRLRELSQFRGAVRRFTDHVRTAASAAVSGLSKLAVCVAAPGVHIERIKPGLPAQTAVMSAFT